MDKFTRTIVGTNFKMKFTNENSDHFSFTWDYNWGCWAVSIIDEHPKFTCMDILHLVDHKTFEWMHQVSNYLYHLKKHGIKEVNKMYKYYPIPKRLQLEIIALQQEQEKAKKTTEYKEAVEEMDKAVNLMAAISKEKWRLNPSDFRNTKLELQLNNMKKEVNAKEKVVHDIINKKEEDRLSEELRQIFISTHKQAWMQAQILMEQLDEEESLKFVYDEDYSEKVNVLSEYLTKEEWEFIFQCDIEAGGDEYEAVWSRWKVLTDEEADEAEKIYLEGLCDDIVISELDDKVRKYFNIDEWVADNSGYRWESLASYDWEERKFKGRDWITYYIYKW